jgi:hypothetical protein
MRRRVLSVLVVAGVALLVAASQPAAAATTVTASEHTTFGAGTAGEPSPQSLTDAQVSGSGTSASVDAQFEDGPSYNVIADEGVGVDNSKTLIGDNFNDREADVETRIRPGFTGEIDQLTFDVRFTDGSDYGTDVVVRIAQEQPDGDFGEGTKVATFDPDFQTGPQTVSLDTPFSVSSGTNYVVEFRTQTSDNDGSVDRIVIGTDTSASQTWYRREAASVGLDQYADITVTDTATTSAKYVGATHQASEVTSGEVDLSLSSASATVEWQEDENNDGSWNTVSTATYSSGGTKSQSLSGTTSDRWRAVVDFSTSSPGSASASLDAERVLSTNENPTVSNPDPNTTSTVSSYDGTIDALVEDPDFPTAQGESVRVTATNTDTSTQIGQTTVTANQTVSLSYGASSGGNNITWDVTDSASQTDTVDQVFFAPKKIQIFNASDPDSLVTGTNNEITVRFFGSGDRVVQRNTTSGSISLGSIPAAPADGYEVVIESDGNFTRRTVVIQSLIQQQEVYLLPTANTSRSQVEFEIDDRTGDFSDDPTLVIERPIRKDFDGDGANETRTERVVGKPAGAAGTVTTVLENEVRYQLRLRNDAGNTRVLGGFTPTRAQTVTLEVGELSFDVREGEDRTFNASARLVENQQGNVTAVRFNYRDPSNSTSKLNVTIRTLDGRQLGTARALNGPYGRFSLSEPVSDPENNTYVVEFNATVDGQVASGQLRPGVNQLPPGIPLKTGLKNIFAVGLILMVGGLFSAANARVGAVVTPLFAGGLWVVNWLPSGVTVFAIAIALGVGIIVNYSRRAS